MPRPAGSPDGAEPPAPTAADGGANDATVTSLGEPEAARAGAGESLVGSRLQHFEVLSEIGAGGMGNVYRARDLSLDREVAIKVIHPAVANRTALHERFVQEARAQARLQHGGIVQIFYIGEQEGRLFFAMELVGGETLDERLARDGRIEWATAIDLVLQAARALGAAQRAGVIHRDIKPSNLLVDGEDTVKVADFGLAKTVGSATDVALTQEGTVLGSPLYISPEQGEGEKADHRSDIYSLGSTFFHLLAGRPPFEGKTAAAAIAKHISVPPPKIEAELPELPESVTQVLYRMLQKDPAERYQDYDSLIGDLEAARPRPLTRAGFWVRGFAATVDAILLTIMGGMVGWWALPLFALYVVLLWWRVGKTAGKWLFRLRVRTHNDRSPSLPRCVGRLAAAAWGPLLMMAIVLGRDWLGIGASFVEGNYDSLEEVWRENRATIMIGIPYTIIALAYLVGLAWAGLSRRRLAWHDLLCRTMVVYDLDEPSRQRSSGR